MKIYELTVLIHPDLEMNLEPALKKVENAILESGGKIIKTTDDGKKRLTYAIDGQTHAIFYFYDVELPADAPQKISNALNIADEVIRYLLTVKDERKEKMEARRLEMEKAEAAETVEEVAEAEKVAEEVIEEATEEVDEKASEESKK
ncbi:30S ribosomal protein S6 [Candidatus Saccharibacteria bacterium]|nr:30S ribosomal protein S6 [Candidatus Saccharibacteria bacterium]